MSRPTARARTGQDRPGLYQEITDKITAELEAGRVPWVQPWRTAAANAPLAMPKNACDGLPEEVAKAASPPPPGMVEPEAERLIAATGADFRIGGARAFYSPLGDFVQVPPPQAYFEPIN